MDEKAKKLLKELQEICVEYHYLKKDNVIEKSRDMSAEIRDFCGEFLRGNIYGMEEEEYQELQAYVIAVLEDYMEALQHEDAVLMLDTLDSGLRELLIIYIDEEDAGE